MNLKPHLEEAASAEQKLCGRADDACMYYDNNGKLLLLVEKY